MAPAKQNLWRKHPFGYLALAAGIIVLIIVCPGITLFVIFTGYTIYGLVKYIRTFFKPEIEISNTTSQNNESDELYESDEVVAKIRGNFRLNKLGHAGTLDPIATGVLVLLSGKATKLSNQLIADDKEYRFDILFGTTTDSQDITGKVIEKDENPPARSAEEIEEVLQQFRGEISQLPPMFSAVKINGKRLYKLGREGKTVDREPRKITIKKLVLENVAWPRATLHAVCSKGTYIRTLCNDIGEKLSNGGGCMETLVRLRSGNYSIDQSHKIEEIVSWTPEEFEKNLLPLPVV